ncbi:MAG TPA: pyrimidine dimer DNA glycosylase/endonuclease V [Longimicrobiales bacterium]
MRIWDVDPGLLCRQHLLGEHRELHGLWNILVYNKTGYSRHPETKRWVGKLPALFKRHDALVEEMQRRGYAHRTPLDRSLVSGREIQDTFLDTPERQLEILRAKSCDCLANHPGAA